MSCTFSDVKNVTSNAELLESRPTGCPDGVPDVVQSSGNDMGCITSFRKLRIRFTEDQNGKLINCQSEHLRDFPFKSLQIDVLLIVVESKF